MIESQALPPGVAAAWGLRPESTSGRRARYSLEDVVAAAIALADAEGLGGVSMPRVAQRLGLTQNALYRYVASKEELLVLMGDAAGGDPPDLSADSWRENAERWALAVVEHYLQRPWVLELPVRAPLTPRILQWTDSLLRALRPLPLSVDQRMQCVLLLDGYARHMAALMKAASADQPAYSAEAVAVVLPLLRAGGHTDVADFLALAAQADTPAAAGVADEIAFSLHRILDGIAALE